MRLPIGASHRTPCAPRPLVVGRCSRTASVRSGSVVARAESSNPFSKIGTQLAQAGSQLSQTFTGTAKVKRTGKVDDKVVFVAGASGRLGARIVKELIVAGFQVRAGVRTKEKGEQLMRTAEQYSMVSPRDLKRVQLIEYDLFDEDTIPNAIGNAATVVSAIGASESFNPSGPKKVDGEAAMALVREAKDAGVKRFIMVTSVGTTKLGWPASALNLFWGVLYWKKQAEQALIQSGMAYTILRPGGMERPTDEYKLTHNLVISPRDTQSGGQVSRLQVAEVAAACVANPDLSANKTLELTAEEDAPAAPIEDLLRAIEPEISMEDMAARQAAIADARNRATQRELEAEGLQEQLAEAEETKVLAEQKFAVARNELQETRSESLSQISAAEQASGSVARLEEQLEQAKRQEAAAKAVLDAQRRSRTILSSAEIREITQPILNPPEEVDAQRSSGGQGGGFGLGRLFGGGQSQAQGQEESEDAQEAAAAQAPEPKKGAFGLGLFKKSSAEEQFSDAVAEANEVVEEVNKKATKGGGLFGFFQQDTVYADDDGTGAAQATAQASSTGSDLQAKRGAASGRKSVKELVPRKSQQEASASSSSVQQAESGKPQQARQSNGGFLGGLFGGGSGGGGQDKQPSESAASAPVAATPQGQNVATKPAPVKQAARKQAAENKSGAAAVAQEQKRAAAVESALRNLGTEGQVSTEAKPDTKSGPSPPAPVADKAPEAPKGNGTAPKDDKQAVQQWIANWRQKQKA